MSYVNTSYSTSISDL